MTSPRLATFRSALALFRVGFVLQQIALALVLFVLSVVWLQIPDANVFDIFGTIILALAILALAGFGESFLLLRLVGQAPSRAKLLRGTLILIAAVILWFGWSAAIDHLQAGNALRAGYENSRFSHLLRNVFSYRHIYLWLGWLDSILEWVGTGVIVLLAFCTLAAPYPLRAMARSFRSGTLWMALFVGVFFATAITSSLVNWTPGHGARIELLSLILRLSFAVLVVAVIVSFLLAILAVCIRQATPAGTPEASQPLTAGKP
jgi:hypothetical protein